MEKAEIVAGELVEARKASAKVLELANKTFDEVSFFVKLPVIVTGLFAV